MPMTQNEFMSHHANCCPNCGSIQITDDDYTHADTMMVIDQGCDECFAEWQVYAQITHYDNLETAEEQ